MHKPSIIFGGAGLGFLIGILIGMSISSVVGVVIGAISSVLLVLLGFKEKGNSETQALRVGAFGFLCVAGVLLGVYLRVNNTFAPSIAQEVEKWTSDDMFTLEEAKRFVAYERLGFIPEGVKIDTSKRQNFTSGVLFGEEVTTNDCDDAKRYERFTREEELSAYVTLGGIWAKVSNHISQNFEEGVQKQTISLIRKCLCNEEF